MQKPILFWLQETPLGKEIFIVFYTKKCNWNKCSFCNLPSVSSNTVIISKDLIQQAKYVLESISPSDLSTVKSLFISNNGSVLDKKTFSKTALKTVCKLVYQACPNLASISFETRIEFIKQQELIGYMKYFKTLHNSLLNVGFRKNLKPTQLTISIGYETHNEYLRNTILNKGVDTKAFTKLIREISFLRNVKLELISISVYVLLKPSSNYTNNDAIDDSINTIQYLQSLKDSFNLPILIRFNPTFVSKNTVLYKEFLNNKYYPPSLSDVLNVLSKINDCELDVPIFIGINDENLAIRNGSIKNSAINNYLSLMAIDKFNSNQNYESLFSSIKSISLDNNTLIYNSDEIRHITRNIKNWAESSKYERIKNK